MSRKLSIIFRSALLCCCLAATASYGQQAATAQNNAPRLRGIYTVRIAPGQTPAMAQDMANLIGTGKTPPLFTFNVQSNRDFNNYTGVMVGHDPFNGGDGQANIPTQVIPLVIVTHTIGTSFDPKTGVISTKPGRTVFDPSTAQNKACLSAPNNIPLTLVEQSPIFHSALFRFGGTDVGFTQYVDAFQRANFWDVIDRNSYHTRLVGHALHSIVLDIPANEGLALATTALGPPAFCSPLGIVNLDIFDALVTKHVLPALRAQGVDTSTFPIFLLSNVVQSFGVPNILNCCALGYHGTTGFPIQTYSPSDFDTTGVFGANTRDTAVLSHEVAEWMDDPYGNNPTPAWGHTGQVPGCQNNLEVGDPLSGSDAPPIVMPNRFTYHLQELAFFSWFFQTPSIGIHGWFSNNGTFLKDAGPPCH